MNREQKCSSWVAKWTYRARVSLLTAQSAVFFFLFFLRENKRNFLPSPCCSFVEFCFLCNRMLSIIKWLLIVVSNRKRLGQQKSWNTFISPTLDSNEQNIRPDLCEHHTRVAYLARHNYFIFLIFQSLFIHGTSNARQKEAARSNFASS